MADRLGRAVLEIAADQGPLKSDLADVKKSGEDLRSTFARVAKEISSGMGNADEAVQRFAADTKAAFTSAEAGSRTLSAEIKRLVGADTIERANAVAKAVTAIGGASKLTAGETAQVQRSVQDALAKYKALGIEAPSALRKIADETAPIPEKMTLAQKATDVLKGSVGQMMAAFSAASLIDRGVSSLISWTKEAIDAAGATLDMAHKTGLSTDTIQQMAFVAKQVGTDVDSFTNAAFKLGTQLSGGSSSTRAAVQALGLSFEDLKSKKPDEQFNLIVGALERMENPQERNRLAVELFGKQAREILPAIAEGYTQIANEAHLASNAQLKAIDAASDAWDAFLKNRKTDITATLGSLVLAGQGAVDAGLLATLKDVATKGSVQAFNDLAKAAQKTAEHSKDIFLGTTAIESYVGKLKQTEAAYRNLSQATIDEVKAAQKLGATNDEIINNPLFSGKGLDEGLLRRIAEGTQNLKKEESEAAKEAKKLAEAERERQSVTIELTDAQKAAVLADQAGNVEQGKTALALGITVTQIKIYLESVKDATEAELFWAKTHQEWSEKTREQNSKWHDEFMKEQLAQANASAASLAKQFIEQERYQDRVATLGLRGTALELANIDREERDEIRSLGDRTIANAHYYDENRGLIEQFYDYQRHQVTSFWARINPEIQQQLDGLRQGVSNMFGQMLTGATSFKDGFIGIWQDIKKSVANIFSEIADAFIQNALRRIIASVAGSSLAGGASGWGGLARNALGLAGGIGVGAGTTVTATELGGTIASSSIPTGGTLGIAGTAGGGSGAAAGGLTTGFTGAALGIGASAGGGIASGMLGKYLTGGAGQKAGAIGAAGGFATGALIGTYVFPGVGTLVGGGIGALAGYLSGVLGKSKGAKEDEAANKDLVAARASLLGEFGSVENIAAIDKAIGTNLASGWGEAGKKGAQAFAEEASRFETLLKNAQDSGVTLKDLLAIGQPEQTLEQRLAKVKTEIEEIGKTGGVASKDLIRLRDSLADTDEIKAFKTQQSQGSATGIGAFLSNATVSSQTGASAIGETLQGSYATMRAQGMSAREAFAQLQPIVASFNQQLAETGLTGGESFGTLASVAGIVGNEVSGKALDAISGLTAGLVGAQNAGFLTQSMFSGLTDEIMKQRQAILDTGATESDVNDLTQGDLQKIWQLRKDYNFQVSDTVAKLLDEQEAAGKVGDQYRSSMDRAAIAMERVADALETVLGKTKKVGAAIDGIPSNKTVTVDVQYNDDGGSPEQGEDHGSSSVRNPDQDGVLRDADGNVIGRGGGGGVSGRQYEHGGVVKAASLAGGGTWRDFARRQGWGPSGTDTELAWLTPEEGVVTVSPGMTRLGAAGLGDLNTGRSLSASVLRRLADADTLRTAASIAVGTSLYTATPFMMDRPSSAFRGVASSVSTDTSRPSPVAVGSRQAAGVTINGGVHVHGSLVHERELETVVLDAATRALQRRGVKQTKFKNAADIPSSAR